MSTDRVDLEKMRAAFSEQQGRAAAESAQEPPQNDPVDETVNSSEDPNLEYPMQLTKELHRKFAPAIRRAAAHERIMWEIYPIGAPNPAQPGALVTGVCLFMSLPSAATVGQYLSFSAVMDPGIAVATQEVVDRFARERVNELLAARTQELQRVQQQAAQAGNGGPVGNGEFVLPGQG